MQVPRVLLLGQLVITVTFTVSREPIKMACGRSTSPPMCRTDVSSHRSESGTTFLPVVLEPNENTQDVKNERLIFIYFYVEKTKQCANFRHTLPLTTR